MFKRKGFITFFSIAAILAIALTGCRGANDNGGTAPNALPNDDGTTIISIGPANTEILMALGFGDNIIAADNQFVAGFDPALSVLDMFGLDLEHIISLSPDLVIATDMIAFAGDPLETISNLGITVVYIPVANSIVEVKDSIRNLAQLLEVEAIGETIIAEMAAEIAEIEQIVATIATRRNVYFEISATPFTFGSGTFLNELLETAGGINIFADQGAWFTPSAEVVITLNPEVILTSTNYLDIDPVYEILTRAGWSAITAVQNSDVFFIDTDQSNRPSQNIVAAIRQMAQAIYPEYFR